VKQPTSVKAEQKSRSHQRILDSAAALLRGRGIRASSVADVMKGAGLTVGGFYGHFASKEELFAEALRHTSRATWTRLLGRAIGDTPRARVLSIVERYLARKHRDEIETGCPLPAAVAEVAHNGEPYRGALESELAEFAAALGAMLGAGPAARTRALGLIALMYGALSLSRAMVGTRLGNEVLDAARALAADALGAEGAS
jgi:TetR/AcrR family transcriptional regulator, transcriptional repressor for nem operon